ncbi:MAG: hypothetical protein ACE5LB_15795 [Acidiferrobacterales bacterium]
MKRVTLLLTFIGTSLGPSFSAYADDVTVGRYACVAHRLVVQGKKGDHYASAIKPKPERKTFSIVIAPISEHDPETCKETYKDTGPYMQSWYCDTSFELKVSSKKDGLRGDTPNSFRGLLYGRFWLLETMQYTYRYWETDEAIRQMAFYWEEGSCQKVEMPR